MHYQGVVNEEAGKADMVNIPHPHEAFGDVVHLYADELRVVVLLFEHHMDSLVLDPEEK